MKPAMNQEEYIENKGDKCPFCSSDNITANTEVRIVANRMSRQMACVCGKTWIEDYYITKKLVGYRIKVKE